MILIPNFIMSRLIDTTKNRKFPMKMSIVTKLYKVGYSQMGKVGDGHIKGDINLGLYDAASLAILLQMLTLV